MQKDYAKYTFKRRSPWLEQGWRYRLLLVVFILTLVGCIGYAYYLYDKYADSFSFSRIQSFFIQKQAPVKAAAPPLEDKPENDIQFNFYTELPSDKPVGHSFDKPLEITQNKPSALSKSDSAKKGQYVLQVAAFQSPAAAGELRISLLLAGFEADIVKSLTEDQQTLYLIQLGPYSNPSKAKSVQEEMKGKGIESVVKKITE